MAAVLVTGGTGTLGAALVPRLREAGHDVRVLTRRTGIEGGVRGDLASGEGLAVAVSGAEVIVHAATQAVTNVRRTDVAGTRRLLELARAAGVHNFLYISIAGVDRVTGYPYYAAKLEVEGMVRESGVPWTILRATQFHELLPDRFFPVLAKLGVLLVPRGWPIQPVDVRDVAARVLAAVEAPAGLLPEFGGPEVLSWEQVARACRSARLVRRPVVAVPVPGAFARGWRSGAMLARDAEPRGTITFGDWLRERAAGKLAG